VQQLNQRHEKRRVLILLLGTLDSETASRRKPLQNLLSRANVELFVVSFSERRAGPSGALNAAMLQEFAQCTSGEALLSADYGDHPADLTRRLLSDLRSLHTFGFESTSTVDAPAKLRIECLRPRVKVRSRAVVPILP
jgi:hypothetical protein